MVEEKGLVSEIAIQILSIRESSKKYRINTEHIVQLRTIRIILIDEKSSTTYTWMIL